MRLLYAYPALVTPELIEAAAPLPKVAKYIDVGRSAARQAATSIPPGTALLGAPRALPQPRGVFLCLIAADGWPDVHFKFQPVVTSQASTGTDSTRTSKRATHCIQLVPTTRAII